MERLKDQQNATISGLKLRAEELAQANPSDAKLEEILEYKEEQIEAKEKEITENKAKMDLIASNKLVASQVRSASTTKVELMRRLKVEAEYLNLMETHFGGKVEKMNSFMTTNLVRAECPEIIIDRWNSIDTASMMTSL